MYSFLFAVAMTMESFTKKRKLTMVKAPWVDAPPSVSFPDEMQTSGVVLDDWREKIGKSGAVQDFLNGRLTGDTRSAPGAWRFFRFFFCRPAVSCPDGSCWTPLSATYSSMSAATTMMSTITITISQIRWVFLRLFCFNS
jgi:hypothetical protein